MNWYIVSLATDRSVHGSVTGFDFDGLVLTNANDRPVNFETEKFDPD